MLRCVWGFDHVVKNVQETWIANSGYPMARKYAVANKGLIINDDNALTSPPGVASGNNNQVYLDCTPFTLSGMISFVFAMRVKILATGNTGPLVYVTGDAAGASYVQIMTYAQLPKQNVGDEMFIEIICDLTSLTGLFSVVIDGVQVMAPSAMGRTLCDLLRSGQLWMAVNLTTSGNSGLISMKDMSLIDNISGDGFVGRQGDRRVKKIDFDVADGTGWTTTDGSGLLATLKAAPETANPALAVAPSSKAPLALSMKSTFADTFVIDAIMVLTAGKVDAVGGVTKTQMKDGTTGSVPQATPVAYTTTLKYGVPSGVFARHPSGARWNSANVDTTSFVVLPDQVS